MAILHVVTLNVGRLFHPNINACMEFLMRPQWDVVCLQDLPAYVVNDRTFKERWPVQHFVPMTNHFMRGRVRVPVGVGIFSRALPFVSTSAHAYLGNIVPLLDLDGVEVDVEGNARPIDIDRLRETESRLVAFVELEKDGCRFKVGTTHGVWVPKGRVDDCQRQSVARMVRLIQEQGSLVIAGDFNAARGGEIYQILIKGGLKDYVPAEVKRTRVFEAEIGAPDLVVDYFFSFGDAYELANVETHFGVSDHAALSAAMKMR